MTKRLKNSQEASVYRNELLQEQNGIDPIINEKVQDDVLDHEHFGEQRCRGVLNRGSNSFEGRVFNSYCRYLKHLTDTPLPEILRNLADYLEADNSKKPIHHTALAMDIKKFKSLGALKQKELLESAGVEPAENVKKRANQARKLIKDGIISVLDKKWTINKKEH